MAKIKLSEGFTPIPEGEHVFKIVESNYDEDFGKLEVKMVTKSGRKHTERYSLINNDGEINQGAQNAFSYFAKTALNNFNLEEIDTEDIVGCYVKATVKHDKQPSNKDPKKTVTFVNLNDFNPASSFETDNMSTNKKESKNKSTGEIDLDDLLG